MAPKALSEVSHRSPPYLYAWRYTEEKHHGWKNILDWSRRRRVQRDCHWLGKRRLVPWLLRILRVLHGLSLAGWMVGKRRDIPRPFPHRDYGNDANLSSYFLLKTKCRLHFLPHTRYGVCQLPWDRNWGLLGWCLQPVRSTFLSLKNAFPLQRRDCSFQCPLGAFDQPPTWLPHLIEFTIRLHRFCLHRLWIELLLLTRCRLLGADFVKARVVALSNFTQELLAMESLRILWPMSWLFLVSHTRHQVSNDLVDIAALVVLRLHKDLSTS